MIVGAKICTNYHVFNTFKFLVLIVDPTATGRKSLINFIRCPRYLNLCYGGYLCQGGGYLLRTKELLVSRCFFMGISYFLGSKGRYIPMTPTLINATAIRTWSFSIIRSCKEINQNMNSFKREFSSTAMFMHGIYMKW